MTWKISQFEVKTWKKGKRFKAFIRDETIMKGIYAKVENESIQLLEENDRNSDIFFVS